uniref:Uncharacterized protein n=1 Tax=Amphiprion ocellaris TaxID=80972 RepID=A0AAQ5Z1N4_AMPOC
MFAMFECSKFMSNPMHGSGCLLQLFFMENSTNGQHLNIRGRQRSTGQDSDADAHTVSFIQKLQLILLYKIQSSVSLFILSENMGLLTAVAIAAGAGGAVVSAPFVLGAIGFTSAGIAAGSYAAGMMSSAAVANGGGVAAGSVVAVLQSVGAAGLSATASAAVAGVGATVGWLASFIS